MLNSSMLQTAAELADACLFLRRPQSALWILASSRRPLNAAQHAMWSGALLAATWGSINSANPCACWRIVFIFAIASLVIAFVVRSCFA